VRFFVVFNQFFNIMKRFSIFCLPAVVMAGALLLLAACDKDKATPAPAPEPEPAVPVDLSAAGTANCYIVSAPGTYSFKAVKGNSNDAASAAKAEVLWESFGTDEVPEVGAIISEVSYADNRVVFTTPETLKNGNAVIAVKDEMNQISWSWHIWVCEGYDAVATGQVYYHDAGTLMDRNLGATSATPDKAGVVGLMYQWGRKDPFLGPKMCKLTFQKAASTLSWPAPVASDAEHGTVEFTVKNPTTFITANATTDHDWLFAARDNTLWKESEKTIFDPCPAGWRIPAGASNGVWAKASATTSEFKWPNDRTIFALNFSTKWGDAENIWYTASGFLTESTGTLSGTSIGKYATATIPSGATTVAELGISHNGNADEGTVYISSYSYRAYGYSVRCAKE